MKTILVLCSIFLFCSAEKCGTEKTDKSAGTYKGRLEIQGICMNYTISMTEGPADTSLVVAKWTDESTGKSYQNVFGLANPCDFPSSLKAGDEFIFTIDTSANKECVVCMAYYPTPSKKLSIKIAGK